MPKPTRAELQHHASDVADLFGWRHHHTRRPGFARDGYPDGFPSETLVRAGRLVFMALPPSNGRVSRREAAWTLDLGAVTSVEVYVFGPDQLPDVTRVLRGEADAVEADA